MNTDSPKVQLRDESPSAVLSPIMDNPSMFQLHFERSADAIWLFDPQAGVFVDSNQAAVELMRAGTKEKLLQMRPEDPLAAASSGWHSEQRENHRDRRLD